MNTSSPDVRNASAHPPSASGEKGGRTGTASAIEDPARSDGGADKVDAADRAAVGERLRQAGERRQKTLQQIAGDSTSAPRHQTALEEGNVKALPGGMYRRAMLRSYAESVGLDREAALEQFERTFEPPTHPARPSQARDPRPQVGSPVEPVPIAAAAPATPSRPGRAAGSTRARDMGVLLAVIVVSAVAVIALLTRGDRAATSLAPLERSGASTEGTTSGETVEAPAEGAPAGGAASVPAVSPASPQPAASQPPAAMRPPAAAQPRSAVPPPAGGLPRRPAGTASTADGASDPSGRTAPAAAAPTPGARGLDAAPPTPRATSGELVIATTPPGARVTVNGTGWGESPVTIRLLPFGSKRIRITHAGYVSQERVITLSPERPTANVTLTLSPRE